MTLPVKNLAILYIVRHGQTDWNVVKRVQGQTDIPLNTTGEEQARQIARLFKNIHFDAVFSSDLLRAKRTAEIITLEKNLAVQTTHLLRERNFGPYEGIYVEDLKELEKDLENLSREERSSHKLHPDIENDEELVGRFITFLREISVAYAGKNVLIVCHGALMRIFLIHLGFASYQTLGHGTIENTAYLKVFSDGMEFDVKEAHGVHVKDR